MRKCLLSFLMFFVASFAFAQQLVKDTSLPRAGDVLCKVKIGYTTSGAKGSGVLWDFSQLENVGDANYKVRYTGKADSMLCLSEVRTRYRYKLSTDSLLSMGYESATIRIENQLPEVALRYPFSYGDSVGSYFYGEGGYSHSIPISSYGFSTTVADGLGALKLPELDTLHQVLRVRQDRYIGQSYLAGKASGIDHPTMLNDSIRSWLKSDPVTWHVTHCQWYAPGYRYPVFETFENSIYQSGILSKHFNAAYYYPPAEQVYLEEDPVNYAIREQLAAAKEKTFGKEVQKFSFSGSGHSYLAVQYSLQAGKQLAITYQVNEPMQLELILTTVSGIVLYHQSPAATPAGVYTKEVNLSGCMEGEFILCMVMDGQQESIKISNR